jgi:hypothetical protein
MLCSGSGQPADQEDTDLITWQRQFEAVSSRPAVISTSTCLRTGRVSGSEDDVTRSTTTAVSKCHALEGM